MHPRSRRRVAEHDPQRVAAIDVADRELGVVGPDRPRPDEHGVALGPQAVGVGPGRIAGDPPARAVGGRGAPVEAGGQLEDHVRATGGAVGEVRGQLVADHRGGDAGRHVDARGPEPVDPPPADLRIGVGERDDHPADPGGHQGVGAGRGAAMVAAGLERDVHGGAAQVEAGVAGRGQRHSLGVRAARRLCRPLGHAPVGGHDHAPDPRVGRRGRAHAGGQLDRPQHVPVVGLGRRLRPHREQRRRPSELGGRLSPHVGIRRACTSSTAGRPGAPRPQPRRRGLPVDVREVPGTPRN